VVDGTSVLLKMSKVLVSSTTATAGVGPGPGYPHRVTTALPPRYYRTPTALLPHPHRVTTALLPCGSNAVVTR